MNYYGSDARKIKITSNITSDIYMSRSSTSDPDNFNHDFAIMGITPGKGLNIDSGLLGLNTEDGFSAKIFVHAIDEATDTLLLSQVNITLA